MTSGLFNCYESAADVRSTNEDTWLSRQKLSCMINGSQPNSIVMKTRFFDNIEKM